MSNVVWSTELLALLHAPPTPANYRFLNQWAIREHGSPNIDDGSNNPFFTIAGAGGTVGPLKAGTFPEWNSIGVARYPNIGVGTYANAYHIATEYPAIASAIRSGNPAAYANTPAFRNELTAWSGSGYSGFSNITAPATPVGQSFDVHTMMTDVGNAIVGKPVSKDGGIVGVWKQGAGDVASAAGGAAQHIPGVKQAEAVTGFLGKLTDPHYILRGFQVVGGAVIVFTGVVLLARQVALAADLPDPASAAGAAALLK